LNSANALQQIFKAPFAAVADPGMGNITSGKGNLLVDRDRLMLELINTASGEKRTLAAPTKSGLLLTLAMVSQISSNTIAVTVLDSLGNTTYTHTFTAAGQFVIYESVCVAFNNTTATVNGLAAGQRQFAWQVVGGSLTPLGVTVPTQTQAALTGMTGAPGTTLTAMTGTYASDYANLNQALLDIQTQLTAVKADVAGILTALALLQ
jgi:hypothetical protein